MYYLCSKLTAMITDYHIRILFDDGHQKFYKNLDYDFAKQKFHFFVSACLEFDEFSVRSICIIRGQRTIKLFQNHIYYGKLQKK